MTARPRLDAAMVRAALSIVDVFNDAGAPVRRDRSSVCPKCGPRSRGDAVRLTPAKNLWHCKACGVGGGALDALAGFRGLADRADFPRLLEIGAELAGVIPDADPVAASRRKVEIQRRRAEDDARAVADERVRLEVAATCATAEWARLPQRDAAGERYLTRRGIAPDMLIERGAVRFHSDGPAVALRDPTGAVVNVARRLIDPGDGSKSLVMRGGTTAGTLIGSVDEIRGRCDVVICEGITDSLTAVLAWPAAVVLGASGAARYGYVARLAAPRVKLAGGRILLIIDDDKSGEVAGLAAVAACRDAGLDLARALIVVDLGAHHDLAEAFAAGWRP